MRCSGAALAALALACLLHSAAAGRALLQYDCTAAKQQCESASCKGKINFDCDPATGLTKCSCDSAGFASCFPGSATVRTADGQAKPLSEVQLGERVLSVGADGALQYSPVYMWSSRRPAEAADFLLVRTDAGANLTVTSGHYLFAWRGDAAQRAAQAALGNPAGWPLVLPSQLAVGDVVPMAGGAVPGGHGGAALPTLARVTSVERVQETGVYMPHTLTGAIVVDGVVASELTSLVPPQLAGPWVSRGLAASLRLAFAALPARSVEGAVRSLSAWAHGGPGDAAVSAPALRAPAASAA
ncbi:hypothetical protein ABPG77_001168 [Micractinium sp. CCAP 211/92]